MRKSICCSPEFSRPIGGAHSSFPIPLSARGWGGRKKRGIPRKKESERSLTRYQGKSLQRGEKKKEEEEVEESLPPPPSRDVVGMKAGLARPLFLLSLASPIYVTADFPPLLFRAFFFRKLLWRQAGSKRYFLSSMMKKGRTRIQGGGLSPCKRTPAD